MSLKKLLKHYINYNYYGSFSFSWCLSLSPSLSPVTEQTDNDKLILSCNVFPHQNCSYTVEWLYQGKEEISNSDMEISPGDCSSTVTFRSSTFKQTIYESLKCNVTNKGTKSAQLFPFTLKSSGDKTGENGAELKLKFIITTNICSSYVTWCIFSLYRWRWKNSNNKINNYSYANVSYKKWRDYFRGQNHIKWKLHNIYKQNKIKTR